MLCLGRRRWLARRRVTVYELICLLYLVPAGCATAGSLATLAGPPPGTAARPGEGRRHAVDRG